MGFLRDKIGKMLEIKFLTPENADTIFKKAKKYYQNKEYAEAFQYFKQSHEIDPKNPEYLRGMGCSLAIQGKNEQALNYLLQAINLDPKDTSCLCDAGSILIKLRRYKDARGLFKKAIGVNPEKERAIIGLGDCAMGECDYTKALSYYDTIIEVDDIGLYYAKTVCYCQIGMYADARGSRDRCLALSPPPVIVEILERLSKHYGL